MQTFIVRRRATDIATDNSYNALSKLAIRGRYNVRLT